MTYRIYVKTKLFEESIKADRACTSFSYVSDQKMVTSNILLATFILIIHARSISAGVIKEDPDVCYTPACHEAAQYLLDSMNATVDPCQDFYRYACGGWIETHEIPDDKSGYSTMVILTDQVNQALADLLKNANELDNPKPVLAAAVLFQGCIDEDARERQGLDPLKNVLDSIGGWPIANPKWSHVGYQWHTQAATAIRDYLIPAIIFISVTADPKDSSRHIINLQDIKLPVARDVLVNITASESARETIAVYKNYIVEAAKLLSPDADDAQLDEDADEIIRFESALAQLTRDDLEKKDPDAWYHKMNVAEVERITENNYFEWTDFLNNIFEDFPLVTEDTEVILREIDYLKNVIKLAHDTNPRILANYIGWRLVKQYGTLTTKNFRDTEFRFNQALSGVEKPENLESVCVNSIIEILEFAVGRLYVDRYFTEEEKRGADDIVEDIRSTYETMLDHSTWIDPETKTKAIEKLNTMVNMMGYPPWIKNDEQLNNYYSSMPWPNKDEFFVSFVETMGARIKMELRQWNRPTHRTTEWVTSPAVVNAFNNPAANTITFPAAILHLPYYKYGRPLALNYGAIGSVVGHEISHGFDDSGSLYDKEGNLVNWWSEETKEKFDEKTTCFKDQYSSYVEPSVEMHLNGELTIGDDIADNGGVRNAFIAYKTRALQLEGEELNQNKRLPGVHASPDQLFFLGYATMYCGKERDEYLRYQIEYSDHTIDEFRVVVPFSNSRAFAEAFNCPVGSRMNPDSKCVLW